MIINDYLISDVFIAESRKLKVRDANLDFSLKGVESTKDVTARKKTIKEAEICVKDCHDKADIYYSISILTTAISLSEVVDLEKELGPVFEEKLA
jgi:hypothetical protein